MTQCQFFLSTTDILYTYKTFHSANFTNTVKPASNGPFIKRNLP